MMISLTAAYLLVTVGARIDRNISGLYGTFPLLQRRNFPFYFLFRFSTATYLFDMSYSPCSEFFFSFFSA
jgi:hypothetical protein